MSEPMVHIAPSILAADFARLGAQVQAAEVAGADSFHIDVMDGRFVPNLSMGPVVMRALRPITAKPLDVHLMIVEPERYVEPFAQAGANNITVHLEASPHLHRTIQQIRATGCTVGVALNPHTPASALQEVLGIVDLILVMTVNPGFGGQTFIPRTLKKIAAVRAMLDEAQRDDVVIQVDGGINVQTAPAAVQAGATNLVVGTSVFGHEESVAAGMASLRAALQEIS